VTKPAPPPLEPAFPAVAPPRSAPPEDGRVSRAQRLREVRRAQVLDAARRLFAEGGYHATSVNDIIVAADIARGTFYLYFESKRSVFAELLDQFFATVAGTVRRIDVRPGAPSPLDQMIETVQRIFAVLDRERPMVRILTRAATGIDEEFDRKIADFYGRVATLIETAVRLGMDMGLVRPCDPTLVSWCALGSVKEAIDRVFVVGEPGADMERLGRELVEFNLRAVFLHP
jgi:AcrR family transcriptional regulator